MTSCRYNSDIDLWLSMRSREAFKARKPMEPIMEAPSHGANRTTNRRGSDNSVVLTEDTDSFIIGDRVWVGGTKPGQIAYIGETQFAPGDWAGIVLDEPIGKNDGSVAGCRYFQCESKRGIFSRLTRLTRQPMADGLASPSSPVVDKTTPGLARSSLNNSTTSLASTATTTTTTIKDLQIGERVIVASSQGSKTGTLRYIGPTEFAPGDWCGVELDEPNGKNDGSVADKRYFECKPKHGLFAPIAKVSRSPSSRRSYGQSHKPTGASLNVTLLQRGSRASSRESLNSVGSSVASSRISNVTAQSSRLQKTSLARTSTPVARKTTQDLLKDRQKEIEILRKERDLERERVTKAASQADEAEKVAAALKKEFQKYREEVEKSAQETKSALTKLLEDKELLTAQLEEERRKCEDLLFRFEEEAIGRDDVQANPNVESVTNAKYECKIKELEKQLSEERERVIQLERDGTKLFEAEEELTRLRLEIQNVQAGDKNDFHDLQKRNDELERTRTELEKLVGDKSKTLELLVVELDETKRKLATSENEDKTREDYKTSLQQQLDEATWRLREKCAEIEELGTRTRSETERHVSEIERLKGTLRGISEANEAEKVELVEAHDKALRDKEELVMVKSAELKEESRKLFAAQEGILEQLRTENAKQIQEMSESFRSQLGSRDERIELLSGQLEEKTLDVKRTTIELERMGIARGEQDEIVKKLGDDLEDFKVKLKESEERSAALNKKVNDIICEHEIELKAVSDQKSKLENDVITLTTEINGLKEQLGKLQECVKIKDEELSMIQSSKTSELEALNKQFEQQLGEKMKIVQDMTADVEQKILRINAQEKELNELKSVVASDDEKLESLSEKTIELRDAMSLSEQTKTNLESELRMYEANVSELTDKLNRSEEKVSQLTSQKEKLENEISNVISTSVDSSDKLVKYSEDLRQKEKELDEAREREFELQKSITAVESKISMAEQDLNKANALVEQLQSENEQFKVQISSEKQVAQSVLEKISTSQAVEKELIDKNNNLEESLKNKSTELMDLASSLKTVQENNARLEKELAEALERHKNEKQNLKKLEQQINETGNDQNSMRKNLEGLEKLNTQLLSEKQSMDESLKELNHSLSATNLRIVDLEAIAVNKDSKIKELAGSLEKLKIEKEEAKKSATDFSTKYNDALTELTLLKSSNVNLESQMALEVANLKQQLDDEKHNLDAALEESKNHLDELKKELVVSSENNVKLNQRCSEMESTISQKRTEMQTLDDNLKVEKDSSESLRRQIEALQKNIADKDEVIASNVGHISSLNESEKNLESNISNLKCDLANKNELIVQLESKVTELKKLVEDKVSDNIKEKQKEIDELLQKHNQELASKENTISELKNVGNDREKLIQELMNKQNSTEELLKKYEVDITLKDKALSNTKQIEESSIKTLHDYKEKLKSSENMIKKHEDDIKGKNRLIADLQSTEKELQERIENFVGQINYATEKSALLEESQKQLEKENKKLSKNYNEVVAKLSIVNENLKNSTNNDVSNHKVANQKTEESAKPIISSSTSESEQLKEEYELAKGQIEFLNSVIVDMQRKNEKMACKIQVLEMGVPIQEADDYNFNMIDKKMQPPRMFCDICDQFDLHETEDCPKQAQDPEPPAPVKTDKKVPVQRPYCENCEMFGHDTQACEDTETF